MVETSVFNILTDSNSCQASHPSKHLKHQPVTNLVTAGSESPTSGVFASGLGENKLGLGSNLSQQLAQSLYLLVTQPQILGMDLVRNPEFVIQRCQLIFDVNLVLAHMDAPGHPPHTLGILSQLN